MSHASKTCSIFSVLRCVLVSRWKCGMWMPCQPWSAFFSLSVSRLCFCRFSLTCSLTSACLSLSRRFWMGLMRKCTIHTMKKRMTPSVPAEKNRMT